MCKVIDDGEDEAVDDRLRQQRTLRGQRQEHSRDENNKQRSRKQCHNPVHGYALLLVSILHGIEVSLALRIWCKKMESGLS